MRIIIRRPHAYLFIDEIFKAQGGIRSATPGGCKLADGSIAPLPGVYFLNEEGDHVNNVGLVGADTNDLLGAIREANAK